MAVGTMATPGAHGGLSALKHTGDPGGAKNPAAQGWHAGNLLSPSVPPTEKVFTCNYMCARGQSRRGGVSTPRAKKQGVVSYRAARALEDGVGRPVPFVAPRVGPRRRPAAPGAPRAAAHHGRRHVLARGAPCLARGAVGAGRRVRGEGGGWTRMDTTWRIGVLRFTASPGVRVTVGEAGAPHAGHP